MNQILLGAIAMGFFVAGLFFLRYWLSTRDRFFIYFTVSFFIEAANRVNIAVNHAWSEGSPVYFMVRLVAFGLIVLAIWDKNRSHR
jgi:hypothetical protein